MAVSSDPFPGSTGRLAVYSPPLGLFCAIGDDFPSVAVVSVDAVSWGAQNNVGTFSACYAATWSDDLLLFVALGQKGFPVTSPDGLTWTEQAQMPSANTSTQILGVCWSSPLNLFVAVGNPGAPGTQCIWTSADGVNWALATSPVAGHWSGVAWSDSLSLFVAVGQDFPTNTTSLITSPDGDVWTAQGEPFGLYTPGFWVGMSVCWLDESGLFVAGGNGSVAASAGSQVITSSDGINWTQRDVTSILGTGFAYLNTITAGMCGGITTVRAMGADDTTANIEVVSLDGGITWASEVCPYDGGGGAGLCFGGGFGSRRFFTVGDGTGVTAQMISCSSQIVYQRIYGIPVEIDDNGTETVRELLVGIVGAAP